jgi:hypothetical protein
VAFFLKDGPKLLTAEERLEILKQTEVDNSSKSTIAVKLISLPKTLYHQKIGQWFILVFENFCISHF